MELIVRDRLDGCEYPSDFTDYQHRYVLEKVIRRDEDKIAVMTLGYSDEKKDFEYIVEIVNNYMKIKNRISGISEVIENMLNQYSRDMTFNGMVKYDILKSVGEPIIEALNNI